jgi:hypothetical protein
VTSFPLLRIVIDRASQVTGLAPLAFDVFSSFSKSTRSQPLGSYPDIPLETFPEECAMVRDAGHEIGLHGYSHENHRHEYGTAERHTGQDIPPAHRLLWGASHLEGRWRRDGRSAKKRRNSSSRMALNMTIR